VHEVALIDVAGAGEFCAIWASVEIAILAKDKVRPVEGAIGACLLVPYQNVRCDVAIYQPLEQPDRAISRVAREPLGPKTEAVVR